MRGTSLSQLLNRAIKGVPRIKSVRFAPQRLTDSFDCAACHYLLLWLKDPVAALAEMRRVVCGVLVREKSAKLAYRYACCGLGDQLVKAGDAVTAGQQLLVVEAMKMQNELRASGDGVVEKIVCREGEAVDGGATLVHIAPPPKAG